MDAILHTEIGYRRTLRIGLYIHIVTEKLIDRTNALHQCLVLQDRFLAVETQTFQKHYGVVLYLMIKLRVEVAEQVTGLVVPNPPHVVGNLVQAFQLLGKTRLHGQLLPLWSIYIICFNLHRCIIYNIKYNRIIFIPYY